MTNTVGMLIINTPDFATVLFYYHPMFDTVAVSRHAILLIVLGFSVECFG